jgi:hypothetical protein
MPRTGVYCPKGHVALWQLRTIRLRDKPVIIRAEYGYHPA